MSIPFGITAAERIPSTAFISSDFTINADQRPLARRRSQYRSTFPRRTSLPIRETISGLAPARVAAKEERE